jgi:transcription antitermination factor NusG
MTMRWYVVHAYSQYENSVKRSLEEHIRRASLQDSFGEILVPTGRKVDWLLWNGTKRSGRWTASVIPGCPRTPDRSMRCGSLTSARTLPTTAATRCRPSVAVTFGSGST